MTAVIYNFNRAAETDTVDDAAERMFSALGRYTSAELLELLYVGEEPGFFELMRGLYGLSDEGRTIILITHEPDVAAHADRIIHLSDGRITSATCWARSAA